MNNKLLSIIKMLLFAFISFALISCGSGGGGGGGSDSGGSTGDFITITIDSGAEATYEETVDNTTPAGYDPYVWSSYDTTNSRITLYSHSDYTGSIYPTIVELRINGSAAGTYQISNGSIVNYAAPDRTAYSAMLPALPLTSGTITVTRYDSSAGGLVEGSYDVIAREAGTVSTTAQLTGTFRVTRDD